MTNCPASNLNNRPMFPSGDYDEDGGGGAAKMANALQDGGVDKVGFQFHYSRQWEINGTMECAIHLRKNNFDVWIN